MTAAAPRIRKRSAVAVALAAGFLWCLGYQTGLYASGNLHVLVAGEAYRSAQPSGDRLRDLHERLGVRSVINLRGPNEGTPWYDEELVVSRELGIEHIDFRMSSKENIDRAHAQSLIAVMRAAPKPVLIHCQGGADRTGLASALYLAAIAEAGHGRAEAQLSPLYGHMPLPFLRAFPMTASFETLEGWLGLSDDDA